MMKSILAAALLCEAVVEAGRPSESLDRHIGLESFRTGPRSSDRKIHRRLLGEEIDCLDDDEKLLYQKVEAARQNITVAEAGLKQACVVGKAFAISIGVELAKNETKLYAKQRSAWHALQEAAKAEGIDARQYQAYISVMQDTKHPLNMAEEEVGFAGQLKTAFEN